MKSDINKAEKKKQEAESLYFRSIACRDVRSEAINYPSSEDARLLMPDQPQSCAPCLGLRPLWKPAMRGLHAGVQGGGHNSMLELCQTLDQTGVHELLPSRGVL